MVKKKIVKIGGHTPARPPRGISGMQISKQLVPGSHFSGRTALGCREKAEQVLQPP